MVSLQGLFTRILLAAACYLLLLVLLAKTCCSPLDPKKGCKTATGQTQLGNQDSGLGPTWVLVLVNALDNTVKQSPLALQMFLHGHHNCLKHGSKTACLHLEVAHPVAPRHATHVINNPFAFL